MALAKTIRIVATSDNHLGQYVARLPSRTLEQWREHLRRAFGEVVDAAIRGGAHLMIVAGDLFDSPTPRNAERVYLARCLAELQQRGIVVVAIGGNHDTPRSTLEEGGALALRVYAELGALAFLDNLDDDLVVRPRTFLIDSWQVAVGGFTPRLNLPEEVDPLEGVSFAKTSADLRVLVIHGSVEGTLPPAVTQSIIRRETIARLSGLVDLVVVGDVHRANTFTCGDVVVVIPGATERLTFFDTYAPGYAWIEAGPEGIKVRHERLRTQPRVFVNLPADELDPENPTDSIVTRISKSANPDALARFVIKGVLPREVYRRLNPVVVEERGRQAFFSFELDLTCLKVRLDRAPEIVWTPRRTLADEVRAVVEWYRESTDDPDERAILDDTRKQILDALANEGEEISR
ncbi:MAG TPA: metallophosphoesterase [Chloroflexota bacterium]|nr:metallophosphoesterase [Chloroflexota bacterium]